LIGTAAAMPVHADLLSAAQANDHNAIDMVSIWGHGARATLGGSQVPGLWMLGTGARILARSKPGVLFADLAACNDYQDGLLSAAKVTCPAVLVLGERDVMTPARTGKDLAAALSSAKTVVIPDAGHMLMAEHPNEVLNALIGALV
jgi:pimeloyl-ACP methyl ester carboxylesterase